MLNVTHHWKYRPNRHHLTPLRTAIRKTRNDKCWRARREKGALGRCWWEVNWCGRHENNMEVPQTIKNRTTLHPPTPLLSIYPKETKHPNSKRLPHRTFTAALLTTARRRNELSVQDGRRTKKTRRTSTAGPCSATTRPCLPRAATGWTLRGPRRGRSVRPREQRRGPPCVWSVKERTPNAEAEDRLVAARGGRACGVSGGHRRPP